MTRNNILAEISNGHVPMKLDGALSSYLDFLRFFAALAVLLAHMEQDGLYLSWLPMTYFSHEAVIVFFVMSGLIIYSTTASAHRQPTNYIIARVSRVYSVALPAILFSVLAASLVPTDILINNGQLSNYRPFAWWDMISSALFLNESWMNSASLTMNAPYWSLCYEVWYYLLFGAYFFVSGKLRWVLLAAFACIAGPAILVLFPIWIAGAWVASGQRFGSLAWSKNLALVIFFASIAVIVAINFSGVDIALRVWLHDHVPGFWRLKSAQRLFTDYLVGAAIVANILAFSRLDSRIQSFFLVRKKVFSYLAGFSFTLYLFHRPMSQLIAYYFPNSEQSIPYSIACAMAILLVCLAISYGTERQLKRWRQMISLFFLRPNAQKT